MKPWVVMRAHNDMPLITETLAALRRQDVDHRLLVLDNASDDGTREEAERYADRIDEIPAGTYVPGRVLNRGMELTDGEFVFFLNSDCTPQHSAWLREMSRGFADDGVAAVFGRQIPRPDCELIYAKDTEDTYGDGSQQKHWKHCFSMASSAIRRSVWEAMPFREDIQYSEDIDWTWRARQAGHTIRYAAASIVMHSHNYSIRQFYRRHYGEGKAEARIFEWTPWECSILRYSILPYGRQVLADWKAGLRGGDLRGLLASPVLRLAQLLGRRAGFLAGMKEARS